MLLKKVFTYSILLFCTAIPNGFGQAQAIMPTIKWVVLQSSNLQVNGSTNVNQFSCAIPACSQVDTISVCRSKMGKEIALSGSIDLNIQSFDCHNSMMTKDLRKTLKEKQFPKLFIKFISLSELPDVTNKQNPIVGQIEIEIAGVHKRFDVNYSISIDEKKVIQLLGERDINFSDFNLIPPKRLAGLVKAKDKLTVVFHLNMKAII